MRKHLRPVLTKDTPWWLLSEGVSVAKKCHTSHSCSVWGSGLRLGDAAGLLRKSAAALQKGTEIGSSWSEGLAFCEPSCWSLSTTSPCIRCLSIGTWLPTPLLTLLRYPDSPFWLWLPNLEVCSCITCMQCWTLWGFGVFFVCFFLLCLQHSESKNKEKGQVSYWHAVKLSLEVDQKRAGRALRI